MFGKKQVEKPTEMGGKIAVIVVTLNLEDGKLDIAGSALAQQDLAVNMLIEAAHAVINKEPNRAPATLAV